MKNTKLTAFAIVLLCGTSLAQTNWMDWRYGRPGVQVITNAPSRAEHTALSNLVAGVSGVSVSTVDTMITNAVKPLSAAIVFNTTAITALSTGIVDHAAATGLLWTASGHYGTPGRLAGFFEGGAAGYAGFGLGVYLDGDNNIAVNNETIAGAALGATAVQPSALLPLVDTNELSAALAAIPASDAYTVRDSTDTNRWWRFEGTQAVQYALGAVTNYTVTLSEDFEEGITFTGPSWTTNVWPFTNYPWSGYGTLGDAYFEIKHDDSIIAALWRSTNNTAYPVEIVPYDYAYGIATVSIASIYYPTNATGNVLGPIPTNLVTDASLAAWWVETEAGKLDAQEFEAHVSPAITQDPHTMYLLKTWTNSYPVAGNTLLVTDGTNLTVTGSTWAYRAFPTNAYQLGIAANAYPGHYGGTIIGTNAVSFSTNLLLRGTATVTGTNCFALQYWSNGVWEVLWGGK